MNNYGKKTESNKNNNSYKYKNSNKINNNKCKYYKIKCKV